MPHATPYWPFCAMPGASRSTKLGVDTAAFGDGYIHRATRGLNPARPAWSLNFPFTSKHEVDVFDQFLKSFAAPGFWFTPPESEVDVFVTVDDWTISIVDKTLRSPVNNEAEPLGTLSVTFTQSFNPQPIPIPT